MGVRELKGKGAENHQHCRALLTPLEVKLPLDMVCGSRNLIDLCSSLMNTHYTISTPPGRCL